MEIVVADSSFYIHELRQKRQPFREMEELGEAVEWATTGMIVLEVCRGFVSSSVRDEFLARYACMIFLPTSNRVWEEAARIAWQLDRKGRSIPAQDIIIATHCLQHDARLLTTDGHFAAVPGLKLAHSLDELT